MFYFVCECKNFTNIKFTIIDVTIKTLNPYKSIDGSKKKTMLTFYKHHFSNIMQTINIS